ncbi:hypothetical protein GQ53DRAFT_760859 [Thozetella sp. PMI_491]|nr:hypothetical protein GQ53DRAFT_760859 [Thozetella sp. PMI_491]
MRATTLTALGLFGLVNAATTVDLFLPSVPTNDPALPELKASVMSVAATIAGKTKTTYVLGCTTASATTAMNTSPPNPCRLVNFLTVVVGADGVEYNVGDETFRQTVVSKTRTVDSHLVTKVSMSCGIESNVADCTGAMTSYVTVDKSETSGTDSIGTIVPSVTEKLTPVRITAGAEKLVQTTATTSSSTGSVPKMTQHALLAGVAAVVGGAVML